jgi:sugar lactone lactonase YvrE
MHLRRTLATVGSTLVVGLLPATAAHAKTVDYDLPRSGVLLEGIGLAPDGDTFYVSGVNDGGDVYRGEVGEEDLELWHDATGTTGRGIDVDDQGRVYVAGGPTGTVRILDEAGEPVATVANGTTGSFLNDLWVGPDGAVYVTDSSLPMVWRVAEGDGGWQIEPWLDVSDTISYTPDPADFDLGGIVTTRDDDALLTSQGTTGQLWRIDLATREIVEVDLGSASIPNADGIVLKGKKLWVVQNFLRQVSMFKLASDARSAELRRVQQTPADHTLTTAKLTKGRLLAVDSQFGFPPAATAPADDRVLSLKPSDGQRQP